MFVLIILNDVFRAPVNVTNMYEEIHTLLTRINRPLRIHIPNVDLNLIVFSLTAHGPALVMTDTFATVFGGSTDNVDLYIRLPTRSSGRTVRLNYEGKE
jgi:hypothetical protein